MALKHLGYVDLPPHVGSGGFDHAAAYQATGRVYVAHTANDAIDVIDMLSGGERREGGVRVRALCHLRSEYGLYVTYGPAWYRTVPPSWS